MDIKSLQTYKEILQVIEKRSTCLKLKVAALLIKDDRIISTGWNGVPSKHKHCCDFFSGEELDFAEKHHEFHVNNELHAEQNCIAYAAKNGISTDNSTLFISISPCCSCAKLIIAGGIKSVYYINEYKDISGNDLLSKSGIKVMKLD